MARAVSTASSRVMVLASLGSPVAKSETRAAAAIPIYLIFNSVFIVFVVFVSWEVVAGWKACFPYQSVFMAAAGEMDIARRAGKYMPMAIIIAINAHAANTLTQKCIGEK